MSEYLSWFEGLCTALNSNPAAATPALTQFRSSDDAHSVCIQVLSNSSRSDIFLWNLLLSGSESMEAYVQNKLIQVYVMTIKKSWRSDSDERRCEYFQLVEMLFRSCPGDVNRLYMACKVLRVILEDLTAVDGIDTGLTQVELSRIRRDFILGGGVTPTSVSSSGGICNGVMTSGRVSGLQLAANMSMALLRQAYDLTAVFEGCLSVHRGGSPTAAPVSIGDSQLQYIALAIREIAEAVSAVLKSCESSASSAMDGLNAGTDDRAAGIGGKGFSAVWSASGASMAGGSSAGSGMNSPSAALSCHSWLPLFLSNDMVCAIFQLHQRMRSVILELHFPSKAIVISTNSGISIHVMQQTLSSCLGSISQMIISFASVDAGIAFPTREQKLSNGEILLAGTLVYLESNVFSSVFQSNQMEERAVSTAGPASRESTQGFPLLFKMRDDGEYAVQEFCNGTDLLMRILGNFKLSLVSNLQSFEKLISLLPRITDSLSTLILMLSSTSPTGPERMPYANAFAMSSSILDGPLGTMLSQCLDVWSILLGDSMLSGFAMSLSEEELWMAGRLRVGLKDICGKLFENLYRCVIAAIMQDTLEAEDDEIDVETDSISERSVFDLIRGVSCIGRMSIVLALGSVASYFKESIHRLEEFFNMVSQTLHCTDIKQLKTENIKSLEVQRLSVEFISCLIIDSENMRARNNATGGGFKSSEIPLIPNVVLDNASGTEASSTSSRGSEELELMIVGILNLVLQNLQQQCRFHQLYVDSGRLSASQVSFLDSAVSHVVAQELLLFLREFVWAYVDADSNMYEVSPSILCRKLAETMTAASFNTSFLGPLLEMSFYCVAKLGNGNPELAANGLGVLHCISRLKERLYFLANLPVLHQYLGYAKSSICPSNVGGSTFSSHQSVVRPPDHSLTTLNQALMWQYLGYIFHELAAESSSSVPPDLGVLFLKEICSIIKCGLEYCISDSRARGDGASSSIDTMFCIASYRGLVRCSFSLSPIILGFVEETLLPLCGFVDSIVVSSRKSGNALIGSRLLSELLGLLGDFAEATPLSSLPQSLLSVVMAAAQGVLLNTVINHLKYLLPSYISAGDKVVNRLSGVQRKSGLDIEDKDEMSAMFIDILTGTLVYLDHIASSDVAISLKGVEIGKYNSMLERHIPLGMHLRSEHSGTVEVDALLCTSLLMLSHEIISMEMISSFCAIQDKYLSIVNLVLRSHPMMLGIQWISLGKGLQTTEDVSFKISVLQKLLSQILCSIDSCDSAVGRGALLALKSFGVFYKKISGGSLRVPSCSAALCERVVNESGECFLLHSLSYLLGMMMPVSVTEKAMSKREEDIRELPGSRSPLMLLKDRTDTFASTLLELVQIDGGERLRNLLAEYIKNQQLPGTEISQQLASTLEQMRLSLEKLFSDRGVNIQQCSKANERNFILNMRDCLVELQLINVNS